MKRLAASLVLAISLLCAIGNQAQACGDDHRYPLSFCAGSPFAQARGRIDASGNKAVFAQLVTNAAFAAGVPVAIAQAVVRHESNYNARARARAGEWGLGQIKCQTARGVGFRGSCHELADASTNLAYAMAYLKQAIDKGGAGCAGVSLYNMGVLARARCTGYGRQIMARAARG